MQSLAGPAPFAPGQGSAARTGTYADHIQRSSPGRRPPGATAPAALTGRQERGCTAPERPEDAASCALQTDTAADRDRSGVAHRTLDGLCGPQTHYDSIPYERIPTFIAKVATADEFFKGR